MDHSKTVKKYRICRSVSPCGHNNINCGHFGIHEETNSCDSNTCMGFHCGDPSCQVRCQVSSPCTSISAF